MAILCVEGDDRFVPFLRANTARWSDITLAAPVLLAERTEQVQGHMVSAGGTSRFELRGDEVTRVFALDNLLDERHDFRSPALIKSDTDGFEERVVRGAASTLAGCGPVLFLEYYPDMLRAAGSDGLGMLSWVGIVGL